MFRLPISNQNNHFKISYANVIRGPSISFTFKLLFYQHVRFYLIGVWVFGVRLFWAFDKTFHSFPIRGYFQWVSPVFIYLYMFFFLGWEQLGFFFFFFQLQKREAICSVAKRSRAMSELYQILKTNPAPESKHTIMCGFYKEVCPLPQSFFLHNFFFQDPLSGQDGGEREWGITRNKGHRVLFKPAVLHSCPTK